MIHTGCFFLLVLKHDLNVRLHVNSIKKVSEFPKDLFFLTGPPPEMSLDWPPVNLLGLAALIFLSVGIMLRSEHLNFFDQGGGPVWDSDNFLKSVTYRPTLSKFRGGPVKKITKKTVKSSIHWHF